MTDESGDPQAYINRVRAEIEAEAETRRRRDPALQRRERDIERAWIAVAPPGAAGSQRELLLDRADRLAMIDVDVPLGERTGIRQIKGGIRKGIYWYLRYVTDQVNALSNVLTRLLRQFDRRLAVIEETVALAETAELADPIPEAGAVVARSVAGVVADRTGTAVVLGCSSGDIARALHDANLAVHGVDADALTILPGVRDGIDLRVADPATHLDEAGANSFDVVVAAGFVENLGPAAAHRLLATCAQTLRADGVAIIVTADPGDRTVVERELRAGRGLSPQTWLHLATGLGFAGETVGTADERIRELVVLRPS